MNAVIEKNQNGRVQKITLNTEEFVGESIFLKIITNVALRGEKIISLPELARMIEMEREGNKLEYEDDSETGTWRWTYTTVSGRKIVVEPGLFHLIITVDFGNDGSEYFFSQIMRYVLGVSEETEDVIEAILRLQKNKVYLHIDEKGEPKVK